MLYPWAYTYGHPPEPDYTYYKDLATYLLETLTGWEHGNDWEVLRYLACGNAVDWEYDGTWSRGGRSGGGPRRKDEPPRSPGRGCRRPTR